MLKYGLNFEMDRFASTKIARSHSTVALIVLSCSVVALQKEFMWNLRKNFYDKTPCIPMHPTSDFFLLNQL